MYYVSLQESKPQPVAQSTPDGNSTIKKGIPTSTQLRQRKLEAPISPLTRANSIGNERYFLSAVSLLQLYKAILQHGRVKPKKSIGFCT